jgi:outer membrane receptor protein involved in Fe transport
MASLPCPRIYHRLFGGLGLPAGTPCSFVPGAAGQTYPNTCDLPSALVAPSGQVLSNQFSERWTPKVWNASLSHSFADGLLVYLTYGTAWRRGGAVIGIQSGNDPVLTRLTQLQPENSKGWELGLKTRFLDNRAQVNIAAYRQTFEAFSYFTPYVTYLGDNMVPSRPHQSGMRLSGPSTRYRSLRPWTAMYAAC